MAILQVLKSAEALYILGGRLTVFVALTLLNELYQIFLTYFEF